ncbi:MAG: hypothetical protein U1E70_26470 [Acetobacteraceae bacterium]|nr:hypothetical protein [Pseudomonadota bacterium]
MMQRFRPWFYLASALGALVLVPGHLHAQAGAFGWSPDTARLTDEDNRLMWDAMVKLNRSQGAMTGESRSWQNAASGNSGKVLLEKLSEINGMRCHELRYSISFSGQPVPQDYQFTWCRTANGEWKIAPQ